jgi:hypothetical protein
MRYKNRMELRIIRQSYLVGNRPHTLENGIRTIKFGSKLLKMFIFE